MTLLIMKKVIERLLVNKFKRIHSSYIVATGKVKSVLDRKTKLSSGSELSVKDSYLDFFTYWKKV